MQILIKAKELGITLEDVTKYRSATVSRETINVPEMKAEEIMAPLSVFEELSEDKIKYWATPHYDEIVAREEAMKNAKQRGENG